MRIQITGTTGVTTKQGKFKPYKQFGLEFNDLDSGREKKKTLVDFNGQKAFDALVNAALGSTWEVTEKPGKDPQYTDWVDASPAAAADTSHGPVNGSAGGPRPPGPTPEPAKPFKSTYETPEERAKKQVYIVRQSSVANAIAYLGASASVPALISVAKEFEAYVFGSQSEIAGTDSIPTVE